MIGAKLRQLQLPGEQQSRNPFVYAAAAGLILGLLLRKVAAGTLPALLAVAAVASLYKYTHTCPTCEHVKMFGLLDPGLTGTVAYAAALAAWFFNAKVAALASALICPVAMIWQSLSILQGQQLCLPCILIYGANAAMIVSVFGPIEGMPVRIKPPTAALVPGCAALVLSVAWTLSSARSAGAATTSPMGRGPAMKSLVGKSLRDLGLPPNTSGGPILYLFGLPTCEPCSEAKASLERHPEVPCRIFALKRDGDTATWPEPAVPYDRQKFPVTPTLFAVSAQGKVLAQYRGWSSDPEWVSAFLQQVQNDLGDKSPGGKEK